MFNSTKINNSPRTKNTDLYTNIHETANGISRSFIQPKITSTPLIKRESIFATPPKHSILSPRRYSLSEIATPPRSNRRDLTKVVNTTGPLLASTKYNINVSTYEDTKSPGFASRIVQYNEETQREKELSRPPTHQTKYDSPGLFPVVHLFKKKLPTLEQKPRRVTIRIASPEYSRHHSQEYNRKLLEGIVKPSSPTFKTTPFSTNIQSSSTRSVLDALKEISRKRIHTNEEYDLNEDTGKRLRTMNNGESSKRLRDTSPLDKSPSPSRPTSKRVCMYDEYAASCSSTDFSFKKTEQHEPKRKSISISTLTDNQKEPKQIKLINAETQTVTTETVATPEPIATSLEDQDKTKLNDEPVTKEKSPLKIFDDAPLERIRKNRLAALMGSLTGKEPVLLPKPDYATVLNSEPEDSDITDSPPLKSTEKPLVSILSSPKKVSPIKSNKHVHFSVPESTSETNLSSTSILSFPVVSSSAPVAVPPLSSSETALTLSKTSRETPAPPSSPVSLQPSVSDMAIPSNSSSATSVVSKESSTSSLAVNAVPKSGFVIPNFQFNPPTTSNSIATAPLNFSATKTTPPKMGGFKFDLSKPVAATTAAPVANAPTFSFGSKSNAPTTTAPVSAPGTFNFGAKAITTTASGPTFSTGLSFGTTTTSSLATVAVTGATTPTFAFGSTGNENKARFAIGQGPTTTFAPPNVTVTATTTSAPSFGSNTPTPAPSFGSNTSTPAPSFGSNMSTAAPSFGSNTSTPAPSFGSNTSTSSQVPSTSVPAFGTSKAPFFAIGASKTTSAMSGFGVPSSATSSPVTFGAQSSANGFGTPSSSFPALPAPNFGVATTTSTVSGGFGVPTTSNATMFGGNKTALPFGTSVSTAASSSPFGKSNTPPQFGQTTTQPSFGSPTITTTFASTNAFGTTTTTTASSLFAGVNSSPGFGTKTGTFPASPNNANIFGGPVNTQPSGFGTSTSKPMFGSATTSPFVTSVNTTTTASFGSGNPPAFNFTAKTTAASSFGTSNSFGMTTTASTGFGNAAPPSFGTSNSFGPPPSFGTGNAFGGSSTPAFGAATTTTQSGFGVTTTPSFGTAGTGFNSVDKSSVFGNSSAVVPFGNNAPSPFGAPTSTSNFGTSSNAPGFGTSTAVSAFAKPQTTQNPFNNAPTSNSFATNNSFGSTQPQTSNFGSTNPNAQNAVFNFGTAAPPKPPGVFSFGAGAGNDVPKPSFNFTGGNAAPPAFGSSGAPSFGSGGPPPFGAPAVPQFGSPQTGTQGMFSIGSGSSTGKARTHLKPKRRT